MAKGREYPERPMVAVGALLVRGSRILLVKRRNLPNEGRWSVPGGLVELGESMEDAVRREVLEELGIRATVGAPFEVVSNVELDEAGEVRFHFVIVDYGTKSPSGRIRLNQESSEYGWFDSGQVRRLEMTLRTKNVALDYLRAKTGLSAVAKRGRRTIRRARS